MNDNEICSHAVIKIDEKGRYCVGCSLLLHHCKFAGAPEKGANGSYFNICAKHSDKNVVL